MWWPRSLRRKSPNAARLARTTASARPPWRTARLPATSNGHGTNGHVAASVARSDLLRLATAGSVDDGKSTLIGRLLHDAKAILSDQLDDLHGRDGSLDLSRLTDGLRAEREQGITIDVAYRYFATARRSF